MPTAAPRAVQDFYPDDFAHCYGCGRLSAHGLHVRSVREDDEMVARFTPRAEHMAMPGFVYGGLLASLIDCHAMGTAAAAAEREDGREIGDAASPRFVTAPTSKALTCFGSLLYTLQAYRRVSARSEG